MHERTGTCGLFWTLERWEAEAIQEHLVRRLQLQFSGREGELRTALRQLPSLQSLQNASDWRMSDVRVLARFLPVCLRRPYGSGRDPFPSHFAWDPAVLCVNTRVTRFLRSGVFLNYQNKPTPYQNPMKNSWTNRGWFKPIQKKPPRPGFRPETFGIKRRISRYTTDKEALETLKTIWNGFDIPENKEDTHLKKMNGLTRIVVGITLPFLASSLHAPQMGGVCAMLFFTSGWARLQTQENNSSDWYTDLRTLVQDQIQNSIPDQSRPKGRWTPPSPSIPMHLPCDTPLCIDGVHLLYRNAQRRTQNTCGWKPCLQSY